ncbi:hypothetical protein AgCh_009585 [Apium graveolens]
MARLQQTQRKRVGSVPRLPDDVVAAIAAERVSLARRCCSTGCRSSIQGRDPIFVWCGPQPNSKLLINYGFMDDDNPYDRIMIEVPMCASMDEQLLDAMCDRLKPVLYTEKSCIVREGDPVDEMLFVMRGKILRMTTNV